MIFEGEGDVTVKIVIFGGSGFIGKHLIDYFSKRGDAVILVTRSERTAVAKENQQPLEQYVTWNTLQHDVGSLEHADAFINLAGETINQRWTVKAKEKIITSRVRATEQVAAIVNKLTAKPKVVINGSAVGIYGMSDSDTFEETSSPTGDDFLADVVKNWETAADLIAPHTRVIKLRLGVVLGMDGGALPKMMLPYKLFVGGRIGHGNQWLSWIHIDDLVQLFDFCITNESITGPLNATAPQPVTNDQFGRTLGKELHRPHIFPVPAFIFKILFGEMAQMLLNGQKVLPKRALESGFEFKYPTIEKAVKDLI